MPAVWMRFRSELRARWRATLALALLVGLVAGVALAALAAARRTDSAFTRLVHETKAWDVDVNPDLGMSSLLEQKTAAVEHLPMVAQAGRIDGLYVTPVSLLDPASAPISLVGDGRFGYTFARFKMLHGRMPDPRRPGDVVVNPTLARRLRVHVGAPLPLVALSVDPAGATHTLHVVGRVILPGLGTYPGSDKTALGEGAVVTTTALAALGPNFQRVDYFLDFRAGASSAPAVALLRDLQHQVDRAIGASGGASTDVEIDHLQRPSDIVSYERVRSTPALLAAVLAVLALATVAHALVTTIRRRRRDFALLKTLGFTRRQVSASVAWQATTVALAAIVVGVPLGVAGGRWAWTVLADDLGTVPEPAVPWLVVAVVVPLAVLLLTNALAFVPGRLAARLRPATALRTE